MIFIHDNDKNKVKMKNLPILHEFGPVCRFCVAYWILRKILSIQNQRIPRALLDTTCICVTEVITSCNCSLDGSTDIAYTVFINNIHVSTQYQCTIQSVIWDNSCFTMNQYQLQCSTETAAVVSKII